MTLTKSKLIVALAVAGGVAAFSVPHETQAYTLNHTYRAQRTTQRAANRYIIAHETGTYAPAINNAQYMNRAWRQAQAFTTYVIGDGGVVYQVAPEGYVSWGAGSYANANSPVQVELARTTSESQFKKDYTAYIGVLSSAAKRWGIPVTLDKAGNGIKSHNWVTAHLWGNHTDPVWYLSSHGVSMQQFAADLKRGKPSWTVTQSKPATSKLVVDGYIGRETIKALQRHEGTPVDGVISPASRLVIAMQKRLGVYADGYIGPITIRAMQRKLGTPVDGVISPASRMVMELQRRLNSGTLPF